ncbi:MAG: hypothetical protein ACQESR_26625 [Planctomycetota bacterium]
MSTPSFQYLAALIAAHPQGKVVGRTRLQKTVRLLQRMGFPTRYAYTTFFYGPFSEGLQSEIQLLEALSMVEEDEQQRQDGTPYYIIRATSETGLPNIEEFAPTIRKLAETDAVILELAATYDTFRELGSDHDEALRRLRRKKGEKCEGGNEGKALELLEELGLSEGVLTD